VSEMREHLDAEANAHILGNLLMAAGLRPIDPEIASKFDVFLALLLRWNARMNLTAIRDPKEILRRHFVESIACAQALPAGIATLLDFGSGAGFPGIPIALCRPEVTVTLAESQSKKAAFLNEVVRNLNLNTKVFAGRAEGLGEQFDCVALRAVDRMEQAVASASDLVRVGGWLAILTTQDDLAVLSGIIGNFSQQPNITPIAGSKQQLLVLASNPERMLD
jgi:16S rRNA (guanine527-N7)-methyltransferase